jgi:hypothetical protein
MKKMLVGLLILLTFALSGSAFPETFTWSNPTVYVDGSAIPTAKQVLVKTHLFWGTSASGPWTEFAVVTAGAITYTGTPPPERGVVAYYTLTAELDGIQSAKMLPSISYTRPFVACNPGSNLAISPSP